MKSDVCQKISMDTRLNDAIQRIRQLLIDRPSDRDQIKEKLIKLEKLLKNKQSPNDKSFNDETVRHSQTEIERKRVDKRLKGFVFKESKAWKLICSHYGSNLNQVELLSIAEVIGQELSIKVDREAKRRKEVLIKWFEENIDKIEPILERIVPEER